MKNLFNNIKVILLAKMMIRQKLYIIFFVINKKQPEQGSVKACESQRQAELANVLYRCISDA